MQLGLEIGGGEAILSQAARVGAHVHAGAHSHDAVEHVGGAGHAFHHVGYLVGQGVALGGVGAEDFDFDGLHGAHQVAQHVANDLAEVDGEGRLGGLDARADVGNDFLGGAPAVGFQADEVVAPVGLSDEKAHLGAGAARVAGHFRHLHNQLFGLAQHAVGFLDAGAGGGVVVEHDGAFVHVGQKASG